MSSPLLVCPKCGSARVKRKDRKRYECPLCRRIRKREAQKQYRKTPEGKAKRTLASKQYRKTPEGRASHNRRKERYRKTPAGRIAENLRKRRYRKTEKGRAIQNAGRTVWKAIKRGKLVRKPCIICDSPDAQGHHFDYSKPLKVLWLCRKHHLAFHRDTFDLRSILISGRYPAHPLP